jgi:hypothetical protein
MSSIQISIDLQVLGLICTTHIDLVDLLRLWQTLGYYLHLVTGNLNPDKGIIYSNISFCKGIEVGWDGWCPLVTSIYPVASLCPSTAYLRPSS